ncbi:MAG: MFS transporter [Dehalococcoidia bacterium]|nr:MFS transporter [Dehalococcoidia bacterium]
MSNADGSAGRPAETQAATPGEAEEFTPLPRRQVILTMAGVMLGMFLASLDQTVVGTAMPRIVADLGGLDRFTWIATAYLVASTTAVPIVGRLTDIYGRKYFYIAGIVVFLVGSVLAGLSQTMNQLIACRALQGLGGGVIFANAFVSIADLFPPAERGKYQGLVAAVFGISSVIGPTLGGFLTDTLSWHWIFYINLPLGIPIIALFIIYFPNMRVGTGKRQIDYLGMMLLIATVVPLLIGLSWGTTEYGWTSVQLLGFLAFSLVAGTLFIVVERRVAEPIMPLSIYRNRTVSLALLAIFLTGFGMFGGIIFIPLFFQGVLGESATNSGAFLTPMMLGMVFGAAISGQTLSRMGGHYRIQGLIGTAIMGTGIALTSRMTADTSSAQAVVNIVVMGLGLGITFPGFTIAVQNAVPHRVVGAATSATQFYRSIGGTLGLAVLGSVMTNRFGDALINALPQQVAGTVPPELLVQLQESPQALVDPNATAALAGAFSRLGPNGAALLEQVLAGVRSALAAAISDVFLVSAGVVVLAFAATLFLREVPLRGRGIGSDEAEAGAPAREPAVL